MPFPQTVDEMKAHGYELSSAGDTCRALECRASIDWWRTPKQKWLPTNAGTAMPHWKTCKKPDQFGKKRQ